MILRSPYEIINYLGQVLAMDMAGRGGYLTLSGPDGSLPLFKVRQGTPPNKADVTARVNGVVYYVPDGGFTAGDAHFATRALAIVKDIITLNTDRTQLPKPGTVVLGGALSN